MGNIEYLILKGLLSFSFHVNSILWFLFVFHSRKDIETREFFSEAEFQEALAKEIAKEERKHEQVIKEYQDKIDALNQQYMDLENEFRIALTVEARRFKDVRTGI